MHVILAVHAANNDQQSAVACSIASSHEDLHEITSISSCVDSEFAECRSKHCVKKNGSLFEIPINHHSLFSSLISSNHVGLLGCKMFHPPVENNGQIHHNFRINFGIHHDLLHEFFIHHNVLVTCPSFSNLSHCSKFAPRKR